MAILTTSMPQVIDALLGLYRGLNLKYGGDPVEIFDGHPGLQIPDVYLQIGGIEQIAAQGSQEWHSLGAPNGVAPSRDERYAINHAVFAYIGGDGADETLTTDDAQKTARDAAFAIVAAVEVALRTNPKLATVTAGDGLLPGNGLGTGWLEFGGRVELQETTRGDPEAKMGRKAVVLFEVGVFHRLYSN